MSNYTQATDFSAKDALASGNPSKIILGADIDAELSAISTAISSKLDNSSVILTSADTADKMYIYDTSAAAVKTITAGSFRDESTYIPTSATATTSGNSKEITGISSLAKRITVTLNAVSVNSSSANISLEIGAGSYDITGYTGGSWDTNSGSISPYSGNSFEIIPFIATAGQAFIATVVLTKHLDSSNTWMCTSTVNSSTATGYFAVSNGKKALTGVLDRLKLTTSSTFDAGAFNILVEI